MFQPSFNLHNLEQEIEFCAPQSYKHSTFGYEYPDFGHCFFCGILMQGRSTMTPKTLSSAAKQVSSETVLSFPSVISGDVVNMPKSVYLCKMKVLGV